MTIKEMHKAVLQQIGTIIGGEMPSEDIELYLNKSIIQFVKTRIEPRKNEIQYGFEQSQERIDDLRELLVDSLGLNTILKSVPFEDKLFIDKADLPDNYMYLINTSALIKYNTFGVAYTLSNDKRTIVGANNIDYKERKVQCNYNKLTYLHQASIDPFNKTNLKNPTYTISNKEIQVLTDNKFIVDKIYITYIRKPIKVSIVNSIDCDLAESTHDEIVELAINLIRRDFQTGQSQQNANSE